jgi:3-phenylpropionate/trans-cinnamate dioxygenase ferredoxin subunit
MTAEYNNQRFVAVVNTGDLSERQIVCVEVEGLSLAISQSKGLFYAVENLCTHAVSTFDEGRIKGCFIICPLHGAMFDMRSGEPKGALAKKPLRVFGTRVNQESMLEVNMGWN